MIATIGYIILCSSAALLNLHSAKIGMRAKNYKLAALNYIAVGALIMTLISLLWQ
jgi:hypothetical protein